MFNCVSVTPTWATFPVGLRRKGLQKHQTQFPGSQAILAQEPSESEAADLRASSGGRLPAASQSLTLRPDGDCWEHTEEEETGVELQGRR